MSNQTRSSTGWMDWRWWVVGWVVASTLGIALGYAIGPTILFPVIAVLTIGISLAIIQSLALRPHIPNAGWWILASITELALAATIIITLGEEDEGIIIAIALGASLGMMQWLFLIMKSKRWLVVTISLPIIALLGWFLYEQVLIWATPVPRFIVSSGKHISGCEEAAQLYEAEPVEDEQTAKVTRSQASIVAARVVGRHYGIFNFFLFPPPNGGQATSGGLVQATFPDGQRRLAWYRVIFLGLSNTYLFSGESTIVYLDALTGEPLMLVTDISVGSDPCSNPLSCECPRTIHLSLRQLIALALLTSYLLLLTVVLTVVKGAVWLGGVVLEAIKSTRQPSG